MLVINKPEIIESLTGTRLQAEIDIQGKVDVLWYEVDEKYKGYLTVERADAFVLGLLSKAINDDHDITVNYYLSERLYYTLNNYLIPVLANTLNGKRIKVHCSNLTPNLVENCGAVGTGLSCGVDSFSTIYEHMQDDCPKGYQISHLTFFNVGSHGSHGGEKARGLFNKRFRLVKKCAEELGKDLIVIDSNLSELLQLGFAELHTIRNMSAVLILQKLFKVYYYASSVPLKGFTLGKSIGSYDAFSLNMLSTENINLFSSCTTVTRFDKTRMITNYKTVQKYLNVCIKGGENCAKCIKCLRTLLTLELLGEIDKFSDIFDLNEYHKSKRRYIISVLARRKISYFKQEIYEEMIRINYKAPIFLKVISKIAYLKIRFSMSKSNTITGRLKG